MPRARSAVAGLSAPAQARRRCGEQGRGLPTLHGDAWRRPDQRAGVQDVGRRFAPFSALEDGRRLPRADRQAVAVGNVDRRFRPHLEGRRRYPLFEATNIMMTRFKGFGSLVAWGLKIAKQGGQWARLRGGRAQAFGAHARDVRDGSTFRFKAPEAQQKPQTKRTPKLLAATA